MGPFWAFLTAVTVQVLTVHGYDQCKAIDKAIKGVSTDAKAISCKCLLDPLVDEAFDNSWIGCAGQPMSTLFKELGSLNETLVNRVHIWDSILNIIPSEMFEKVRPKKLIIENSLVSVVRPGAFSVIGSRLAELRLRNNAFKKTLDPNIFNGLNHLQSLDLSGNKLTKLQKDDFSALGDLKELIINDNAIAEIEDGAFGSLSNLRVLSLQNNQLSTIKRETFKGLENLEVLYLQNNQLSQIDWTVFRSLKKLKVLDLGRNHIEVVDLQGIDKLEKLIINNNSIKSLRNVSLRNLPTLIYISLDRNFITEIGDDGLRGLSGSPRLETISMASNNISRISSDAFKHVPAVRYLALQSNAITSLTTDGRSILSPLRLLSVLILSGNKVEALKSNDLPKSVHTLAADHNHISHIDVDAFYGLRLQRLLLHDNWLTHLPKGTFDQIDFNILQAIDLTSNRWQCVCEEEWLGSWLTKVGNANIEEGVVGCLALECKTEAEEKEDRNTGWVTFVAGALAIISIIILGAIVYLYYEDNKMKGRVLVRKPFRRVDSDLLKLINEEAKTDAARGVVPKSRPNEERPTNRSVRFAD